MPLRCVSDEGAIVALDFATDEAWQTLRERNAKDKSLRMPCCEAAVILKRSKLGTRFFAHARTTTCDLGPETAEHLLAKEQIAQAVQRAGWQTSVEQYGQSPESEQWTADVLASDIGERSVAFEVQWSNQAFEETSRRQQVYRNSDVRGVWLLRQHDIPVSEETPAFRLVFDGTKSTFEVWLPSVQYISFLVSRRDKDNDALWHQRIELGQFVEGTLRGRLHFSPPTNTTVTLALDGADRACWNCKKETVIVIGVRVVFCGTIPGTHDLEATLDDFDENASERQLLAEALPPMLLAERGIGAIKTRYSHSERESYLSNGCVHCDALQGASYNHEIAWKAAEVFRTEIKFDDRWATMFREADGFNRWWFETEND